MGWVDPLWKLVLGRGFVRGSVAGPYIELGDKTALLEPGSDAVLLFSHRKPSTLVRLGEHV